MAAATALPGTASFAPLAMPRPKVNKWLVTVSVTFGTLMGAIDASIVNVAIPHIRGAVGATVEEITWISTAFALATVLVMPLTAFLGRLFGQKRVYLACLILFVAGSALCGMARSLPALVAFRMVQGFGAGALQPTEQAILRQTFPANQYRFSPLPFPGHSARFFDCASAQDDGSLIYFYLFSLCPLRSFAAISRNRK